MDQSTQPSSRCRMDARARLLPASMNRYAAALVVILSAVALMAPRIPAQTRPKLADYFTQIPQTVLDARYSPLRLSQYTWNEDLDGDGNQDLVVLGFNYPFSGVYDVTEPNFDVPQPGRVFLGDGNGHFAAAPTNLFPIDTLQMVFPRKVLFADFNADGRPDMFISTIGWDILPSPGEQNRLYLSRPEGGWRDATDTLPQLRDYSHSAAAGDISGRGVIDIFVGNVKPALNAIRAYTLLNNGSGQFTQMSANLPVGNNQVLDQTTGHRYPGATLADLNDDGLPELIVTGNSTDRSRPSTILWNRLGVFVETDATALPAPVTFTGHYDTDVQRIDVNQDGLPDLVLVGGQNTSLSSGWFVQILVNQGNRQFVDETADRVPPGDGGGGTEGVSTSAPAAHWVRVLDFNQDGAPDFSVEVQPNGPLQFPLPLGQPLVWLNDGTGHFSTLKVGDFVTLGQEGQLGMGHLVATRNGFSFISTTYNGNPGGWPLSLRGLLATKPYRITPSPRALHQ
jgi:FG-GAP-like repeat